MIDRIFMVFDVESVGLHGEGFAVGYVVVEPKTGIRLGSGLFSCSSYKAIGIRPDHQWVDANVPSLDITHDSPLEIRSEFWDIWLAWKAKDALLLADCCWPVEARFLAQCVDDSPAKRELQGPYPLVDLSSILLGHGRNPVETFDRVADELPKHNPLCDARQSARILCETLKKGMPA
jgi:hypothetical protein